MLTIFSENFNKKGRDLVEGKIGFSNYYYYYYYLMEEPEQVSVQLGGPWKGMVE